MDGAFQRIDAVYRKITALSRGMFGLILVEPEDGLPPVDKEFYILQSEFYTNDEPFDSDRNPGTKVFQTDFDRALEERPTFVVFNGHVGALKNEGVLKATTKDKIRLFVGNAGPNLVSSFHIIGTKF